LLAVVVGLVLMMVGVVLLAAVVAAQADKAVRASLALLQQAALNLLAGPEAVVHGAEVLVAHLPAATAQMTLVVKVAVAVLVIMEVAVVGSSVVMLPAEAQAVLVTLAALLLEQTTKQAGQLPVIAVMVIVDLLVVLAMLVVST
jgi:hypothetical protein